jgi:hypothetical protein
MGKIRRAASTPVPNPEGSCAAAGRRPRPIVIRERAAEILARHPGRQPDEILPLLDRWAKLIPQLRL